MLIMPPIEPLSVVIVLHGLFQSLREKLDLNLAPLSLPSTLTGLNAFEFSQAECAVGVCFKKLI